MNLLLAQNGVVQMSDASITFFPVNNGDMSHIRLSDKTDIIIDCNITEASLDDSDNSRFNVHDYLLRILDKDQAKNPHVDCFILSHPDEDHCRGFKEIFYIGDPSKFGESHRKRGLIIIDEVWFAPRIFTSYEDELCESAKALKEEAERRMDLYKNKNDNRKNVGNRLRIIGYSDDQELKGLEGITTIPGSNVNLLSGDAKKDFSFFIHAPFKKDTDSEEIERNETCIVLQARFDVDGERNAGLAFFGGDAGCATWKRILKLSDDEDLQWDIFMAPHHCSWSFFSEEPYKDNKEPSEDSLKILDKKRDGAIIVASCKPIKNDDDNPPHFAAAKLYEKVVGDPKKFYVTSEYPNREKPRPLKFEISKNGPVKQDQFDSEVTATSTAIHSVIGTPKTYGY
jgi:hypothetical protein